MTLREIFFIIAGIKWPIFLGFSGFLLGFVISIGLLFLYFNKYTKFLCQFYVSFFRGVPLFCQLLMLLYIVPMVLGFNISILLAILIVLSLNSAAYTTEILRSGFASIDMEQIEAAISLGINRKNIFIRIITPQVVIRSLPSIINELISICKETVILSNFGIVESLARSRLVGNKNYDFFKPLLVASISYYVLVLVLTQLENIVIKIQKKM